MNVKLIQDDYVVGLQMYNWKNLEAITEVLSSDNKYILPCQFQVFCNRINLVYRTKGYFRLNELEFLSIVEALEVCKFLVELNLFLLEHYVDDSQYCLGEEYIFIRSNEAEDRFNRLAQLSLHILEIKFLLFPKKIVDEFDNNYSEEKDNNYNFILTQDNQDSLRNLAVDILEKVNEIGSDGLKQRVINILKNTVRYQDIIEQLNGIIAEYNNNIII